MWARKRSWQACGGRWIPNRRTVELKMSDTSSQLGPNSNTIAHSSSSSAGVQGGGPGLWPRPPCTAKLSAQFVLHWQICDCSLCIHCTSRSAVCLSLHMEQHRLSRRPGRWSWPLHPPTLHMPAVSSVYFCIGRSVNAGCSRCCSRSAVCLVCLFLHTKQPQLCRRPGWRPWPLRQPTLHMRLSSAEPGCTAGSCRASVLAVAGTAPLIHNTMELLSHCQLRRHALLVPS